MSPVRPRNTGVGTWGHTHGMCPRVPGVPVRTREGCGVVTMTPPATVDSLRGWPMPDGAWDDDCRPADRAPGFLPWAIWQPQPDWYVGFYTCDRGHAWTCGHGAVASLEDLAAFRVSPTRRLPSDTYLRRHAGDPASIVLRLIDWRMLGHVREEWA